MANHAATTYQPPVDRSSASRRDRPRAGASRPICPFCAFLRFSASFCVFLCFLRVPQLCNTWRSTANLFCAVRHGSTGSSHHELNGMVRPAQIIQYGAMRLAQNYCILNQLKYARFAHDSIKNVQYLSESRHYGTDRINPNWFVPQ